jgi:hypothetical protein
MLTSQTVTPSGSPLGIIVQFVTATGADGGPNADVIYGGITLTKGPAVVADGPGLGSGGSGIWYSLDISGRATDLLTCASVWANTRFSVIFVDGSTGVLAFAGSDSAQGSVNCSVDFGSYTGVLGASTECVVSNTGADVSDVGPGAGFSTTTEYDWGLTAAGVYYKEALSGVVSDWTQNTWGGRASRCALGIADGDYDIIQAAPYKLLLSHPTSSLSGFNDANIQAGPYVLQLKLPKHIITPTAPRLLPLVGENLEMAGRVPAAGALTIPLLTETDGRPVWFEGSSYAERTRLVPLTGTGASGDPGLVWADDDQLIMTEYWDD